MTDEARLLGTAFVTALVTIGFTELVRAWFQRRRIRWRLYREIIYNCGVLEAWVHFAKNHPECRSIPQLGLPADTESRPMSLPSKMLGFIHCEAKSHISLTAFIVTSSA